MEVDTIIDAPSLAYFTFSGYLKAIYTLKNLNSQSEAEICLDHFLNTELVLELFAAIDMAKVLTLSGFGLEESNFGRDPFKKPIFRNLRRLELGSLLQIYEENILPEEELGPFPSTLKVIKLKFFSGKQQQIDFIEYFLLKAESLEKLILLKTQEVTTEVELRISHKS
ncbi:hypothetical protein Droror1_Dr00014889 [Drosera rotundifolia]